MLFLYQRKHQFWHRPRLNNCIFVFYSSSCYIGYSDNTEMLGVNSFLFLLVIQISFFKISLLKQYICQYNMTLAFGLPFDDKPLSRLNLLCVPLHLVYQMLCTKAIKVFLLSYNKDLRWLSKPMSFNTIKTIKIFTFLSSHDTKQTILK